ncbi:MAG: DUF4139 domain-containing protein [Kiritimatiellae bacterium]|nr:DUF4139 domain-containing protein [Kiritimatiellia bacterium]
MKRMMSAVLLTGLCALAAHAAEQTVESRIVSVGLFKNGLAVVKRRLTVPGPGTYRVEDVPSPVHGTFWLESDAKVHARAVARLVDVPLAETGRAPLADELAGHEVVIHFRDGKIAPAAGKVLADDPAAREKSWSRAYEPRGYSYWHHASVRAPAGGMQAEPDRFLVLETETGRSYVDTAMIAHVEVRGTPAVSRQLRPVLLLSVADALRKPAAIEISYLSKGMAWAPSYRIDIADPKTLTLEQKAVIKNELFDVEDVDVFLISGFPSVQFSHVTSPLSLTTTWTAFFEQLNQNPQRGHSAAGQAMYQQALITSNLAAPSGDGPDLSAIPTGEGVDLHYQPIGKQTVLEGESIALSVASATAAYDRIVEWLVPDTRKADGRYIEEYERSRDPDKYEDAAWDALRFKNPLAFPMTTGPAMIVSGDRFNGQRMSYWVNPGEQHTVRVTRALSLRTKHVEHEEDGGRDIVYVGGRKFRKVLVKGELFANNHRKEPLTLVVRRHFSGDLLEADGTPRCSLLEEGVYSVNKRNELTWELTLKPGEERQLTYRYSVLVYH